ncbi:IucA/IucC family protein [Actinoplanes derwentensis]|uniref:Siderophore synthetase component n=1 Tax=Actinoplanes derwentensis TaxID=113562 RepID=A0A1H1W9Z5_9ACTN|nr:IucA/IucC family protein [Actinoplanes derwentensis]GID84102.1 iron transporter [Actinoplanes derwentensis]SDS93875.1 Siderophore synthetase component [Actinoplanes derwentensis]
MIHIVSTGRLAAAATRTEAALAVHAPHLVDAFTRHLPAAADTVGRRLRAALVREDLTPRTAGGHLHAFHRVEYPHAGVADPVDLLAGIDPTGTMSAEIRNAVINLAIALARFDPAVPDGANPDLRAVHLERLAVAGHNLHPCGRTRLGWDTADVLAHDLEAGHTPLKFIAVRDDAHLGDDLGAVLEGVPAAPPGYRTQPLHGWQHDTVLHRYADLFTDGTLRRLDGHLDAVPTSALRTLLLPGGQYLKVSLDIQVTSTRRSISVASTRNGPALSRLLHRLVDDDRILLMAETAGAAVPAGSGRDLSAIVRTGLTGRLQPGELAIPGGALPAYDPVTGRTVLAGLVDQSGGTAETWLTDYTRLLLPPLLRLLADGVALEAHLQNCLPTFRGGHPHRLALRDFAGLRLHPGRLADAGHTIDLWPGSVVGTGDTEILRAKLGYTALQAHLGELVIRLAESHHLDETRAWRVIREVVDDTYDTLSTHRHAAADHSWLIAAQVPHKALVRMRLAGTGDIHIPVSNPLHG